MGKLRQHVKDLSAQIFPHLYKAGRKYLEKSGKRLAGEAASQVKVFFSSKNTFLTVANKNSVILQGPRPRLSKRIIVRTLMHI